MIQLQLVSWRRPNWKTAETNQHACLNTDHKNVMKKLEATLFGLHEVYKQIDPADKEDEEMEQI